MFRTTVRRGLDLARSRPGAPSVQFTPEGVRGGNILYYWQWAHSGVARGFRRSVLRTEHMTPWLQEFPALETLTTSRLNVGILDQRTFATRHHYGSSFTSSDNRAFSQWLLEETPSFAVRVDAARQFVTDQTCVVNVRRGDYYSVPEYRVEFGIDIRSHIAEAVRILKDHSRWTGKVVIVSDDPEWCRENLHDILPWNSDYIPGRASMFDDLAALAAARTLILANSTFSYWGSFLANTVQADHLAIAPPFHQRNADSKPITDLFDPHWPKTSSATDRKHSA